MSDLSKLKKILTLCKNPQIVFGSKGYIFIISHIRSRSSLLSHILGTNPAISGHSELHYSYLNWKNLLDLSISVYQNDHHKSDFKFALDKILWNNCHISKQILLKKNLQIIFLIRDPEPTLKSIINLGHLVGNQNHQNPSWALNYYCSRLKTIEDYASITQPQKGLVIDSDKLIQDTDNVLYRLKNWLGLEENLTQNYKIFANTGKPGHGDPSGNLEKGKIIKNKKHYENIHISPNILNQAKEAYESCQKILLKNFENV